MKFYSKCLGCGSLLQDTDSKAKGYVTKEDAKFCIRCFKLKNYSQITKENLQIIKDESDDYFTKVNMQLEKENKSQLIYVFDAFYFNPSSLPKLNRTKSIVIINKFDLLPKAFKERRLLDYYYQEVSKYLDVEELFLVSVKKNNGLDELYEYLSSRKTKFYLIGHANVGKSSLINVFLKMNNNEQRVLATVLPGTTLDQIEISYPSFKLIDLPGYFEKEHPWLSLDFDDVRNIVLQKEVKIYQYELKAGNRILLDRLASFLVKEQSSNIHYLMALSDTLTIHRTNAEKTAKDISNSLFKINGTIPKFEIKIIKLNNDGRRVEFYIQGIGYVMTYAQGQTIEFTVPTGSLIRLNQTLFSKSDEA